jgi:hypothetical protein
MLRSSLLSHSLWINFGFLNQDIIIQSSSKIHVEPDDTSRLFWSNFRQPESWIDGGETFDRIEELSGLDSGAGRANFGTFIEKADVQILEYHCEHRSKILIFAIGDRFSSAMSRMIIWFWKSQRLTIRLSDITFELREMIFHLRKKHPRSPQRSAGLPRKKW